MEYANPLVAQVVTGEAFPFPQIQLRINPLRGSVECVGVHEYTRAEKEEEE